jgi:4-alpha-glucanotransferase
VVVQCDGPFRHEQRWRGTGLAVPVFALRTRNSVGVGEFADIEQLADFCSAAGVWL